MVTGPAALHLISCSKSNRSSHDTVSKPDVGSSSRRTFGQATISIATLTRFLWPKQMEKIP